MGDWLGEWIGEWQGEWRGELIGASLGAPFLEGQVLGPSVGLNCPNPHPPSFRLMQLTTVLVVAGSMIFFLALFATNWCLILTLALSNLLCSCSSALSPVPLSSSHMPRKLYCTIPDWYSSLAKDEEENFGLWWAHHIADCVPR